MIIIINQQSRTSPDSSIYCIDTNDIKNDKLKKLLEIHNELIMRYELIEKHIHSIPILSLPQLVEKIVEVWT